MSSRLTLKYLNEKIEALEEQELMGKAGVVQIVEEEFGLTPKIVDEQKRLGRIKSWASRNRMDSYITVFLLGLFGKSIFTILMSWVSFISGKVG